MRRCPWAEIRASAPQRAKDAAVISGGVMAMVARDIPPAVYWVGAREAKGRCFENRWVVHNTATGVRFPPYPPSNSGCARRNPRFSISR